MNTDTGNHKILYILNVANKVNNFSYSSMLAAKECGFEFHIAGNWGYSSLQEQKADEEKYGIKIHQIDFIRTPYHLKNIKAYKQLVRLIKEEKIDYIHCNTPIGGLLGRLAGKKCRVKKVIYQAHGFHFYKGAPKLNWLLYYPIERLLARYTDAIITINKEDFAFSREEFKLRNNGKIHYVRGVGIDLSQYTVDCEENTSIRNKKRNELGIEKDDIVLISAGRLDINKNNETTIRALANVPNVKFLLCGDGDCREKLMSLAEKLGVSDKVLFLGNRSDINDLYLASDIMVMMSFREGLSRSIMEAMASGLACIVSKIRGNVDLIEHKKGGYLCQATDVNNLSKYIETLAVDISLKKEYGEFNQNKIKLFGVDCIVDEIKKIYKETFY